MYVTFDYKGKNFNTVASLPYGAKEIKKDLYYDVNKKLFYFYTFGDADAYRYMYMSMRVKSIDCVKFYWGNDGSFEGFLIKVSGKDGATLNLFYNLQGIIEGIDTLSVKFDGAGNYLLNAPRIYYNSNK